MNDERNKSVTYRKLIQCITKYPTVDGGCIINGEHFSSKEMSSIRLDIDNPSIKNIQTDN